MALSYTIFVEADNGSAGLIGAASSASRTYNAGEMVTAVYVNGNGTTGSTFAISNTNTAQTWNIVRQQLPAEGGACVLSVWYCVMSTTQAMVITAQTGGDDANAHLFVIVETGQHASDPVPAANDFGNYAGTDVSQAITPTSAGSDLWFVAGDWNASNTFAAIANCTKVNGVNVVGQYTTCLIRPTTQPRGDASAFTLGETDTGGDNTWVAWEVQAAAGGVSTSLSGSALTGSAGTTTPSGVGTVGGSALTPGLGTGAPGIAVPL